MDGWRCRPRTEGIGSPVQGELQLQGKFKQPVRQRLPFDPGKKIREGWLGKIIGRGGIGHRASGEIVP